MIVKRIIDELPREINFEEVIFHFNIFHNGDELRLCYDIAYANEISKHKQDIDGYGGWHNPLLGQEPYFCDFLFLREGIYTNDDLMEAVAACIDFFKKHNLKNELH